MKSLDILKTEKFYVQAGAGVPVYCSTTAESAFLMSRYLGFGFDYFLFSCKQGYLEVYYPELQLKRIWESVKSKLEIDQDYLNDVKAGYDEKIKDIQSLYGELDQTDLSEATETEMLGFLKRCLDAQAYTMGVGHMIEPVSLGLDEEFKERLRAVMHDDKIFNKAYAELTEPSQPSFVYQEQQDLEALRMLAAQALDQALEKHVAKYSYILNGYSGPRALTKEQCQDRLDNIEQKASSSGVKREDLGLVLDEEMKRLIGQIDYSIVWQDERKRNILIGITYLGRMMHEIAKRSGVDYERLILMTSKEAKNLSDFEDIRQLKPPLEARMQGMMYTPTQEGEEILVGEDYAECLKAYEDRQDNKKDDLDAIYGSVANTGTAIGPVAVCRDLASIDKVKQGDILVASMTRPEYMAAIKKAAAIVTDEGGITCHAAIVARELGIPCVIGTKIATQVFRDGDMVEADADHGVVKLITNNE